MAKSTRPIITINDIETGETSREMNDIEFAQYEADKIAIETIKAEALAIETSKKAILDRIGLTADELKTILG